MDILTHAGMGLIAAAPFIGSQPELALGVVAGSVLPDLDALSRLFGKRAFLRSHQTWSHAVLPQLLLSLVAGCGIQAFGGNGAMAGAGLFTGLAFHSFLDFTNTLGVTLFAPFSRKRFCREWVFFIDIFVIVLTWIALGFSIALFLRHDEVPMTCALVYFITLAAYIAIKAAFRWWAGWLVPEALSLVPSALWPWRFLGAVEADNQVRLFIVNVVTGTRKTLRAFEVLDDGYLPLLTKLPEFQLMKSLSPLYHVVRVDHTGSEETIFCRDLRTRNFNTSFGDLEVVIGPDRTVLGVHFHV